MASCGGVIRDSSCSWTESFSCDAILELFFNGHELRIISNCLHGTMVCIFKLDWEWLSSRGFPSPSAPLAVMRELSPELLFGGQGFGLLFIERETRLLVGWYVHNLELASFLYPILLSVAFFFYDNNMLALGVHFA